MSTTFGIYKLGTNIELIDDMLPDGYDEDDFVEVAFRGNKVRCYWINDLARYFPSDMKIYPLDNTAQGIYTIGDFRKIVENVQ